jgi:hypothetical protein
VALCGNYGDGGADTDVCDNDVEEVASVCLSWIRVALLRLVTGPVPCSGQVAHSTCYSTVMFVIWLYVYSMAVPMGLCSSLETQALLLWLVSGQLQQDLFFPTRYFVYSLMRVLCGYRNEVV